MYTEENQRGRFPLRDILLKGIVVIIFIFLIMFIITKVTSSNQTNNKQKTSAFDKNFSENLKAMEEAALKYYTEDKLPKEVLESKKVTLRELINSNVLEAFTDSNGKSCNVNKSYVRLTKNEADYTLRVNLECNSKKDYLLMKVNKYDYCKYDICKKDSSKEKKKDEDKKKPKEEKEVKITEPTETTTNSNIPSGTNSNNNNTNNNTNTNNNGSNGSNNAQITRTYEYKKVSSPVLSAWSSWSEWLLNNNRISVVKCGDTDANCLKEIQLYSQNETIGKDKNNKLIVGRVHYYSYRTRTLISSGSTDIKWSTYNDNNLLSHGYTYTGNFK